MPGFTVENCVLNPTAKCLFLSKQGFLALGEDYLELLGRQSSGRFYRCRMQSAAAPFLSPRTGLLVFPLGTLPPVQAFCPPVPAFLCVLCLVPSCSWGPTRGLVFDEPAAGGRDRCRSGVCLCEVEIVGKGGGAGFEPMTCSGGVLRFRARCQYCTEAKSEVICNPSPELFGSLLFTTKFGVDNVYSLITALRCTRTPRTY